MYLAEIVLHACVCVCESMNVDAVCVVIASLTINEAITML